MSPRQYSFAQFIRDWLTSCTAFMPSLDRQVDRFLDSQIALAGQATDCGELSSSSNNFCARCIVALSIERTGGSIEERITTLRSIAYQNRQQPGPAYLLALAYYDALARDAALAEAELFRTLSSGDPQLTQVATRLLSAINAMPSDPDAILFG